jgi:hypothetical protein
LDCGILQLQLQMLLLVVVVAAVVVMLLLVGWLGSVVGMFAALTARVLRWS